MSGGQEEFEAWFLNKYYEGDSKCGERWLAKSSCGGYLYAKPSEHWSVWQAARQPAKHGEARK